MTTVDVGGPRSVERAPTPLKRNVRALRTRSRASRPRDVVDFTMLLATLLEAGVSISATFETAINEARRAGEDRNRRWIEVLSDIREQVESGRRLSEALSQYPDFSDIYVNMVRGGEASGKLPEMLDRVGAYLEADAERRAAIKGAMAYPAAMAFVALGSVVFLLTYIFPKFAIVFRGFERLLPWPTKFFLALSDFLVNWWPFIIAGAVAAIVGGLYAGRIAAVRRWVDRVKLDIPVFGPLIRFSILSRTLAAMSNLQEAGVWLVDTIQVARDVSENVHYEELWDAVAEDIVNGSTFSEAVGRHELFPAAAVQVIEAGERGGRLPKLMGRLAERLEKQFERAVKTMISLIEPTMIVLMGILIGTIVASLMLPLFRMSQAVR